MAQIHNLSDIEEIERVPLAERQLPESTYAMIRQSALNSPNHPALVFFPDGEHYRESIQVTYRQLLGRIHQVANMLSELGVGPNDVVSLLLPNLPQTHFAFWGAEAAGIANPINPLLEADQIAAILRAARTKVLIALGPLPGSDIWGCSAHQTQRRSGCVVGRSWSSILRTGSVRDEPLLQARLQPILLQAAQPDRRNWPGTPMPTKSSMPGPSHRWRILVQKMSFSVGFRSFM